MIGSQGMSLAAQYQKLAELLAVVDEEKKEAGKALDHARQFHEKVIADYNQIAAELSKAVGRNLDYKVFDVGAGKLVAVQFTGSDSAHITIKKIEPKE